MQTGRRDVKLIVGQNGYGKSRYLRRELRGVTRFVGLTGGFDDEKEFDGVAVPDVAAYNDYMLEHYRRFFRVSFQPEPAQFAAVCRWLQTARDAVLAIDEAGDYLDERTSGEALPSDFMRLANKGRHYGVTVLAAAVRPAHLHKNLRAVLTHVIVFNTIDEDDVRWITYTIGREHEEKIKTLPPFHFLEYERATNTVTEKTLAEIGA